MYTTNETFIFFESKNIEENKSSIVDTLKEKEKKALWEQFLYDYGYAATDHLDLEIANFVNNKGLATKNASFFKNTNCATSVNGRKMPHTSLSPR